MIWVQKNQIRINLELMQQFVSWLLKFVIMIKNGESGSPAHFRFLVWSDTVRLQSHLSESKCEFNRNLFAVFSISAQMSEFVTGPRHLAAAPRDLLSAAAALTTHSSGDPLVIHWWSTGDLTEETVDALEERDQEEFPWAWPGRKMRHRPRGFLDFNCVTAGLRWQLRARTWTRTHNL